MPTSILSKGFGNRRLERIKVEIDKLLADGTVHNVDVKAQRTELQVLRLRRREATLQERGAFQDEIRAFWQRAGVKPTAEAATNATP